MRIHQSYYFGCDNKNKGHFLWNKDMGRPHYSERQQWMTNKDSQFCPQDDLSIGKAALHHLFGHITVLAFWDNSMVDTDYPQAVNDARFIEKLIEKDFMESNHHDIEEFYMEDENDCEGDENTVCHKEPCFDCKGMIDTEFSLEQLFKLGKIITHKPNKDKLKCYQPIFQYLQADGNFRFEICGGELIDNSIVCSGLYFCCKCGIVSMPKEVQG